MTSRNPRSVCGASESESEIEIEIARVIPSACSMRSSRTISTAVVAVEMATSSCCWSPRRWDSSSQSHGTLHDTLHDTLHGTLHGTLLLVALVRESHACCRSGKRPMSLIAGTSRHASCAACWGMQVRQGRLLNPLLVGSFMSRVQVDEGFGFSVVDLACRRVGRVAHTSWLP